MPRPNHLPPVLDIQLRMLGESNPNTAGTYGDLAANLEAHGKLDEAVVNWHAAAACFERARGR